MNVGSDTGLVGIHDFLDARKYRRRNVGIARHAQRRQRAVTFCQHYQYARGVTDATVRQFANVAFFLASQPLSTLHRR
jgi:hypothetical protein